MYPLDFVYLQSICTIVNVVCMITYVESQINIFVDKSAQTDVGYLITTN